MMERNTLQYGVVVFVSLTIVLIGLSNGRELRPSEHGLAYQQASSSPPTQNGDEQEVRSFFGATTPSLSLPEAKNISDTWRNEHGNGRSPDIRRRDPVKIGLLVASAVCGLAGVVLLVVSGIVFLFRLQKKKPNKADRISSMSDPTSDPNAANDK